VNRLENTNASRREWLVDEGLHLVAKVFKVIRGYCCAVMQSSTTDTLDSYTRLSSLVLISEPGLLHGHDLLYE
jgi:hypothetical protein